MSPEAVQKIINTNCECSPDALNLYLICLVSKMFYSKTSKGHFPMSLHILKSQGNGTQPGEFVLQSRNSLFIEWWVRHLSLLTVFRYRNPSTRPQECKLVTLLISSALQCHLSVSLSLFFFLFKQKPSVHLGQQEVKRAKSTLSSHQQATFHHVEHSSAFLSSSLNWKLERIVKNLYLQKALGTALLFAPNVYPT